MSSTGRPAGALRGFDPHFARRVPLAGRSPSTGAACPRSATWRPRGRAVPVERPALTPCGVDIPRNLRRNSREQAYVPAEQPSPSQGARLPPAHADPCRSRHPVGPSSQGPQEPGRLTARARGTRRCSPLSTASPPLTASAARCVRGDAPVRRPSWSTCGWTADAAPAPAQVGFTVGKAVGNAATRNRVKRRLRHLTREHLAALEELPGRAALVVRALPAASEASYASLGADLARTLSRVSSP